MINITELLVKDLPEDIRKIAEKYKRPVPCPVVWGNYITFEDAPLIRAFNFDNTDEKQKFWRAVLYIFSKEENLTIDVSETFYILAESSSSFVFKNKTNDVTVGAFFPSPTGNCQVSCIAGADQLISEFDKILISLSKENGQSSNQLLIDVKEDLVEPFKLKIIKAEKTIVYENPYTSTNGSKMCKILIKMRK